MTDGHGRRLQVDGVSQIFLAKGKRVTALQDVSLTIEPGEFVSFLGPSGCGKSTMMRIVTGLLRASSGTVRLNDKLVDRPQTDLGVVFQSPILVDWRTVLGNVLMQTDLRGLPAKQYRAEAEALLAQVGLQDFMHHRPWELSGGMRQRVAICRALLHDPPMLLMDEPFGALDALTREQMRIDLERLWMKGRKTIIFITHSIEEAVLLSDRVYVFTPRPGRVDQVIPIHLPRPRGLAARENPEAGHTIKMISDLFLARGVFH